MKPEAKSLLVEGGGSHTWVLVADRTELWAERWLPSLNRISASAESQRSVLADVARAAGRFTDIDNALFAVGAACTVTYLNELADIMTETLPASVRPPGRYRGRRDRSVRLRSGQPEAVRRGVCPRRFRRSSGGRPTRRRHPLAGGRPPRWHLPRRAGQRWPVGTDHGHIHGEPVHRADGRLSAAHRGSRRPAELLAVLLPWRAAASTLERTGAGGQAGGRRASAAMTTGPRGCSSLPFAETTQIHLPRYDGSGPVRTAGERTVCP
jgi:hypothetical protein